MISAIFTKEDVDSANNMSSTFTNGLCISCASNGVTFANIAINDNALSIKRVNYNGENITNRSGLLKGIAIQYK